MSWRKSSYSGNAWAAFAATIKNSEAV